MTKPATPKGVGDGQAPDWEAIEREYRAGVLSLREIAKRHGVSHVAIQKRAKKEGWSRDLTKKVREAVTTALVTKAVTNKEWKQTEREIVEDAAAAVVALVREHRADLREGRELATTLMSQLRMAAGNRDALIELIEEAVDEMPVANAADRAKREAKRKAMLAAIALPTHAATLRELANVYAKLIPLERQAFNMDAGGPEDPPADDANGPQEDASLAAFNAALSKFTGKVAVVTAPDATPAP